MLGQVTIETSNDDETWTYFANPSPEDIGEDGWFTVPPDDSISEPVIARFVRIVFVGTEGDPLGNLAEIQIHPPSQQP
jgi:hypothetical protein